MQLIAGLTEAGIEPREAHREAYLIVEHASGLGTAQQILKADEPIGEEQLRVVRAVLARREKRVPLQYCLGYAYFMGLKLVSRPGVLIPRCDTETIVEVASAGLKDKPQAEVVDIGVGCGAISIALLKAMPDCKVIAIDISAEAIALTRENALAHGVYERIRLVHNDWRSCLPARVDAIVSNPPYVPQSARCQLSPEVRLYEPEQALFGDDEDGLAFYRGFAGEGRKHLNQDGFAAVEVGDSQAEKVAGIFSAAGWQALQIHNDLNGLPRVVSARP